MIHRKRSEIGFGTICWDSDYFNLKGHGFPTVEQELYYDEKGNLCVCVRHCNQAEEIIFSKIRLPLLLSIHLLLSDARGCACFQGMLFKTSSHALQDKLSITSLHEPHVFTPVGKLLAKRRCDRPFKNVLLVST
ncbi:hypothetical protein NPIL_646851 [Nephila pilipes]|uniref:Uncharacterized protein n=1 Tax=Nephila pilipes TaxID=299642 RepID=A0A8X6NCT1_NEPPI|nr:hypothetical protein NPIL_646851 [Nephila pilipes]